MLRGSAHGGVRRDEAGNVLLSLGERRNRLLRYGQEITRTHARVAFDAGGEVMRRA